jgi:hypothetical protein
MKTLTKVAVLVMAVDLMKDNNSTTTLDVKNALRAEGYFAKQQDVSDFMYKIAQEEKWNINESNGIYRVFTLPNVNIDLNDTDTDTVRAAKSGPNKIVVKHRDDNGNPFKANLNEANLNGVDLTRTNYRNY